MPSNIEINIGKNSNNNNNNEKGGSTTWIVAGLCCCCLLSSCLLVYGYWSNTYGIADTIDGLFAPAEDTTTTTDTTTDTTTSDVGQGYVLETTAPAAAAGGTRRRRGARTSPAKSRARSGGVRKVYKKISTARGGGPSKPKRIRRLS